MGQWNEEYCEHKRRQDEEAARTRAERERDNLAHRIHTGNASEADQREWNRSWSSFP